MSMSLALYILRTRGVPAAFRKIGTFARAERGSWTVEALIWTPMLVILMAFSVNMASAFYNESRIVHVVQNVGRAHALGRYGDDEAARAELVAQLAWLDHAAFDVDAGIDGPVVTTSVTVAAAELMPMVWMFHAFDGFKFEIVSEQLVEY